MINMQANVGFEVQVRSLAVLKTLLTERHDAMVAAPRDAGGNILRFVERVETSAGTGP